MIFRGSWLTQKKTIAGSKLNFTISCPPVINSNIFCLQKFSWAIHCISDSSTSSRVDAVELYVNSHESLIPLHSYIFPLKRIFLFLWCLHARYHILYSQYVYIRCRTARRDALWPFLLSQWFSYKYSAFYRAATVSFSTSHQSAIHACAGRTDTRRALYVCALHFLLRLVLISCVLCAFWAAIGKWGSKLGGAYIVNWRAHAFYDPRWNASCVYIGIRCNARRADWEIDVREQKRDTRVKLLLVFCCCWYFTWFEWFPFRIWL